MAGNIVSEGKQLVSNTCWYRVNIRSRSLQLFDCGCLLLRELPTDFSVLRDSSRLVFLSILSRPLLLQFSHHPIKAGSDGHNKFYQLSMAFFIQFNIFLSSLQENMIFIAPFFHDILFLLPWLSYLSMVFSADITN